MDEFDKIVERARKDKVEMSEGIIRLLMDLWKATKSDVVAYTRSAKYLFAAAIVAFLMAAVGLCVSISMLSSVRENAAQINALRGEVDAVQSILDEGVIIEETTTTEETTTQTVEGDSATINNGTWEQFNDNSVKNGAVE